MTTIYILINVMTCGPDAIRAVYATREAVDAELAKLRDPRAMFDRYTICEKQIEQS